MKNNALNHDPIDTFKNPDTRERWECVHQAIGFAEDDCARELEYRNERHVEAAPSPFIE